jgi:hypothetical protein
MKTRNGKVARLPLEIREQLNVRLADGEPGNRLVEWLNSNPDVMNMMAERFEGRPITEQNISEWRQGGYEEWVTLHAFLDETRVISENAGAISGTGMTSDHLHMVLLAHHAHLLQNLVTMPEDEFNRRLKTVTKLTASIMKMQRSEQNEVRLQLQRERLELQREKQNLKSPSSTRSATSTSDNTRPGASETHQSAQPCVSPSGPSAPPITDPRSAQSAPPPRSAPAPIAPLDALTSALLAQVGLDPVHAESALDYLDSVGLGLMHPPKLAA